MMDDDAEIESSHDVMVFEVGLQGELFAPSP
jgi:hypothetical protein